MGTAVSAVLAVLSELQFLGFCTDLEIPDAASSVPSEVFDAFLVRFLREAYPGKGEARPLPAAVGDGRRVDLLRLFAVVHAAGGYGAVASSTGGWAVAAESAGLDTALAPPVKLIYAKYLGAIDRCIRRLLEAQPPFGGKKEGLFFNANGREKEEPFLDYNGIDQQRVILKRKRGKMVGMLDSATENTQNDCTRVAGSADQYLSILLEEREAVVKKRACRASTTNGGLLQLQGMGCNCCMSTTGSVQLPRSDTNELTTLQENMNGSSDGQSKHECKKQHKKSDSWHFTSQQRNEIPVGSNYQAQVPQWTSILPEKYNDSETLKWLGTKLWPPENENKKAPFNSEQIGKGREDVCSCILSRSVECVRFHIAEKRLKLKHELGSAFYALGFDGMGEEIALSWTDEEEANFKVVMQVNAPSSGRNIWNQLHSAFRLKQRKELVSYYFNCFLLRWRCYQNRITPNKIDSDDEEETEFRFLGNRFGQSSTKYHSTKHMVCVQSTHCMDLDQ